MQELNLNSTTNLDKSAVGSMVGAGGKELGEPIVILDGVQKVYGLQGRDEEVVALKDITMSMDSEIYPIMKGEFVILRGPSGGGKTTLLNMIGCIDHITGGSLELFGTKIDSKASDKELSRMRLCKIGFVFQTFNLLATMSAFENVELPMTVLGKLSKKERQARATKLLSMVGLRDRVEHLPSELSGGEQQRVTIARALSNQPDLLLLDEPTGDLDTRNTIDVMDLLLDINQKEGATLLMVTHNPDVECYADRVLYIQDGKCVKQCLNEVQSRLDYSRYLDYLNSSRFD